MLIQGEDGKVTAGEWDVLGVLRDASTGRYHCVVLLEHPLPGDIELRDHVRLKSDGHEATGAETLEGCLEQIAKAREKLVIDDRNVWTSRHQVIEVSGSRDSFSQNFLTPRWRKA